MSARTLRHRTLETGHVRQSPADEVRPETLSAQEPLLRLMLAEPQIPRPLWGGWYAAAWIDDHGHLWARIWPDALTGDPPLATMRLRPGPVPDLEVSLTPETWLYRRPPSPARLMEATDLERCLAWTWLDRIRNSRTAPETPA